MRERFEEALETKATLKALWEKGEKKDDGDRSGSGYVMSFGFHLARLGFTLMVGCMVATSLAMAPALLVAQRAGVVDLDGPLLLARDRPDVLRYEGSLVYPPKPNLWG